MDSKQQANRNEARLADLRYPEPARLFLLEDQTEPVAARVETIKGNVVWLEMNNPVQYRSLVKIELSHYLLLGEVFCCRRCSGPYCVGVELQHSVSTGGAPRIASGLNSGRRAKSSGAGHYALNMCLSERKEASGCLQDRL